MNTDLELLLDEPIDGHHYWTIVWRGPAGELRVLDYARGPLSTQAAATQMGTQAMRRHQNLELEAHMSLPSAPNDTPGAALGCMLY
ncbi:hypothetical protein ACSFA8_19445 [Variovorax sp. RT4R15]|uniref:hypothetical protein n=1 Tax=Variovorax sp. RT4R15 TaxID=3443737 RepID=UPI003F480DD7